MKSGIGVGFRMLCALLALGAASLAQAQAYPSKPVRLIVPYPAGGVVDLVARAVADKVSQNWGQVIVVEPRPGGNAGIGAEAVANAAPDGYTLLVAAPFLAVNPHLYTNLKWRPQRLAAERVGGARLATGEDAEGSGRVREGAAGQAQPHQPGQRHFQPSRPGTV